MNPVNSVNPAILIADTDERFRDQLKSDARMAKIPMIFVKSAAEAQAAIQDPKYRLLGIFLSPDLISPSWVSVVRMAHDLAPLVPLHLIKTDRSTSRSLGDEDLKSLGIKQMVEPTLTNAELKVILDPILERFDKSKAMEIAKANPDPVSGESSSAPEVFRPIRSADFIVGTNSFFDVYAKTSQGRHLKLVHAGDDFEHDRLVSYLGKGVSHFYIRKEAQRAYLEYCDHLTQSFMTEKGIPFGLKQKQLMNCGEEIFSYVKMNGMSEDAMGFAQRFSSSLRTMLNHLESKNASIFSKFVQDSVAYEHAVGVALFAGKLALELEITSEGPMQTVAVAALFHDFSLVSMPEACRTEDESKMTPDEIKLFHEHPARSAEVIAKLQSANPAAVQAIQQHHMKLKGRGFPPRNATTPVSRIAEIISSCDELVRILKRCKLDPSIDLITELEREVAPYYSRGVVQAFRKAFYPKTE